jgi:excisionase family DNA binding protein
MEHDSEQERPMAAVVEEPAWISYSEAQRYAGLGRTKLFELVSGGDVEAAKVGRAVRISRRSLEDFMKRNSYVQVAR